MTTFNPNRSRHEALIGFAIAIDSVKNYAAFPPGAVIERDFPRLAEVTGLSKPALIAFYRSRYFKAGIKYGNDMIHFREAALLTADHLENSEVTV